MSNASTWLSIPNLYEKIFKTQKKMVTWKNEKGKSVGQRRNGYAGHATNDSMLGTAGGKDDDLKISIAREDDDGRQDMDGDNCVDFYGVPCV